MSDGKGGEWCVFMFGALKMVAPTSVDYGPCRLGPDEQALIKYQRMWDLWIPVNLVPLMVAESDAAPPYL
jgi:hypothetical protein